MADNKCTRVIACLRVEERTKNLAWELRFELVDKLVSNFIRVQGESGEHAWWAV